MKNKRTWLLLIALTMIVPANASGQEFTTGLTNAAEKLTKILVDEDRSSVSFASFENEPAGSGNFGPGIRSELMLAFESVNRARNDNGDKSVSIVENATFKVKGTYTVDDDPQDRGSKIEERLLVVAVSVEITDGAEAISSLTFYLDRGRDIIAAEGLTIPLDPQSSSKRKDHVAIRKAINEVKKEDGKKTPLFVVDGTKIKTKANSPFAVELVTRSPRGIKYTPRGPKSQTDVLPFVPIGIGEIYGIKVYNNSNHEIAISLKIDGIDQFTFTEDRDPKTAKPRFSAWILGPGKSFTIKGWHTTSDPKRTDNLSAFLVTKYGEGASKFSQQVAPKSVGVISVAIAKSHDLSSGNAKSSAETGFGPPIEQKQKSVKRKIDPPHEFISIRYNR